MRGVTTKRSVSVVGVLQRQPSKLAMEPLQTAAAPARCQRATSARNAASPAVKYCAPWSHCHGLPPSSPRRVLMRPDGPRLFSNTSTRWPAPLSACAQDKPAKPAPTMAMFVSGLCGVVIQKKRGKGFSLQPMVSRRSVATIAVFCARLCFCPP